MAALLLLSLRKRIAVALCAAKINTKIENLTPCKIVAAVNLQCVAYLKNCINTIEVLIDSLLGDTIWKRSRYDGRTDAQTDRQTAAHNTVQNSTLPVVRRRPVI